MSSSRGISQMALWRWRRVTHRFPISASCSLFSYFPVVALENASGQEGWGAGSQDEISTGHETCSY